MILRFDTDGTAITIYNEVLDLRELGTPEIRRASHVEPTPSGDWTADMSPVGGDIIGTFALRSEALAAEIAWLERQIEAGGVS